MVRILTFTKIVVLLAISFFFIELGIFVKNSNPNVNNSLDSLNKALSTFESDGVKLGTTLDAVNNPDPRRGTLKLLNKDLVNVKDFIQLASQTAYTVQKTSIKESQSLDIWNTQIGSTLSHVDQTVVTANSAIKNSTDQVAPLLIQGRATLFSLQQRIDDPNIPKILANGNSISTSSASIMADGAYKIHQLVHPDKVKLGFWGTIDGGLLWAHSHVIPPLF